MLFCIIIVIKMTKRAAGIYRHRSSKKISVIWRLRGKIQKQPLYPLRTNLEQSRLQEWMEVSHTLWHTLNLPCKEAVSQKWLPVDMGFEQKKQSEAEKARRSDAGKPRCSERHRVNEGAAEATGSTLLVAGTKPSGPASWMESFPACKPMASICSVWLNPFQ